MWVPFEESMRYYESPLNLSIRELGLFNKLGLDLEA
jgi:hypothetical protein